MAGKGPDLDLFGRGPKLKRPKAPPADPGAVQRLIAAYRDGYRAQFAEDPLVHKSDGALLKALVAQFGAAKVAERLKAFLAWEDPYVRSTGYALHVFHRQWNRLAAHVIPERQAPSRVMSVEQSEEYRRRLRG